MNKYIILIETFMGDVLIPVEADNEKAANVVAEVFKHAHGDILDATVTERK